jgi:hypothetical protein
MNKIYFTYKAATQVNHPRIDIRNDLRNSGTQLRKVRCLLLAQAHKKHGQIKPCSSWDKCFTIEDNTVFFWYQSTKDNSTHLVSQDINVRYPLKSSKIGRIAARTKKKYHPNQLRHRPIDGKIP